MTSCHSDEMRQQYHDMEVEAEKRERRAQWRRKRFALGQARIEQLKRDQEMEEREMEGRDMAPSSDITDVPSDNDNAIVSEDVAAEATPPDLLSTGNEPTIDSHTPRLEPPIDANVDQLESHVMATKPHPSTDTPTHRNTRGVAPVSTIQDIMYPSTDETIPLEPPVSHSVGVALRPSRSSIKDVLYPAVEELPLEGVEKESPPRSISSANQSQGAESINTRGCPPPTTIENVLYYGRKGSAS